MVGVEAALEIRVLHRHGKSIREITRETGVARNTVRRYLRDEEAALQAASASVDQARSVQGLRRRAVGLGGAGVDTGECATDGAARARLLRRLHDAEAVRRVAAGRNRQSTR
jgi:AcrR family transcriptional regulator